MMLEEVMSSDKKAEEIYFPGPSRPRKNNILPSVCSDSLFFLSVKLDYNEGTQSQFMIILERVLSKISDFVRRVSPNGFYIYIISKNGIVSMLRYSVYAIGDSSSSLLITSEKVRTYDYGGDICCSKFIEFHQILISEGLCPPVDLEKKIEPLSLLRPSPSIDDTNSFMKVEDCLINIMSEYWEKKRQGYSTLILLLRQEPSYSREYPLISNIFIENVIAKDLRIGEEGSCDGEMALLAVLCLQQILSVYGRHCKEVLRITGNLLRKVVRDVEKYKIPSLCFDHGILSRKRAEEIVGCDIPGRYLLYQDEKDDVKKIIVYQCYFFGERHFKEYEVFFKDDGVSLSCDGEDFSDIWHLLSTMIILDDRPIFYRSDVFVLIENQIIGGKSN